MLYERMLAESKRLEQEIMKIQAQLNTLPEGKLISSKTDQYYKWYQSDGHNKIYIPQKNQQLIYQLAIKKYLTKLLADLTHEKSAIDRYLCLHTSYLPQAPQMLEVSSRYHELLSPFFIPHSQKLSEWMHAPYNRNPLHPEQLTHKCSSGNVVRSKSESLIDMLLYTSKLPYRYECELILGDTTLYPDFTVYHPYTSQIVYWEHFGMMDDPKYARTAYSKLQFYNSHGIIPSVNLIITFETKANPLSQELIQKTIDYHFS